MYLVTFFAEHRIRSMNTGAFRHLLTLIVAALSLLGQPAPQSFEVASVKPANPTDPIFGLRVQPGRFSVTNATLEMLVGFAYSLPNSQVVGAPKWATSDGFTIEATLPSGQPALSGNAAFADVTPRLQTLLSERFKLAVHKENRELGVYELVVARGGPKMTASADGKPPGRRVGWGELSGSMPVPLLAATLSQSLDRPVIDKTRLPGNFDIALVYTPEVGEGARFANAGQPQVPSDASRPPLFTALREQLGLELRSARAPVEVLVIDHGEKPDSN